MEIEEREAEQRSVLSQLAALEAEDAQLYARRMVLRARMDELWTDGPQEQFGVLELAGTARIGQGRASTQLINGARLVRHLPGTLAALQAGVMFTQTAVLLLELTGNCTAEVTSEVERRVLRRIARANTTEARRIINRTIPEVEADLDPVLTQERLDLARSRRSVATSERPDAMARISAEVDVIAARRWTLDFEEIVRAQKIADDRAGVDRTQDQRRADVFAQLPSRFLALLQAVQRGDCHELRPLATADADLADRIETLASSLPRDLVPDAVSHPEPPPDPAEPDRDPHWTDLSSLELAAGVMALPVRNPVTMNVHVPMSTALELDHRTARVEGAGDLPAAHARLLVLDAQLRRVFVDPDSGVPIGIDPTVHPPGELDRLAAMTAPFVLGEQAEPRHDPSRRLQALVDLRDQTCTGIGCSLPASRCHKDHEIAYPDGHTAEWNLSAKSARCHRAKHAGWTVTRHGPGPQHGMTTWTSPLGHSYTRLSSWDPPLRT